MREFAVSCIWIAITMASALTAFQLTGLAWLALTVGVSGMILAAWHTAHTLAVTRDELDQALRQRAAMEHALHRSQEMAAVGRLTVGVAHDFNNHLTVINSNVEMLARRLDARQERLLRHTEAAMQGVRRAAMLTGRLLSFSRHPVPDPEAVDVGRLLHGLSDLLRHTLGDRISLDVIYADAPWLIWADTNQLENALLSLTVHSRDHVTDGSRLIIAVSNIHTNDMPRGCYTSIAPGEYVQITVTDSATPVEAKAWRSPDDMDSADLSMARAFVRDAGGCLLRSDTQAGGMSLRILLPRYAPAYAHAVSRHDDGGPSTILVVEDDTEVRSACVEVLRELDYEILEAPDAMEAFRIIADHGGIDLLFTDLGLPGGVNGRALADAARNVDPAMRVLFTTGSEHVDLTERAGTALLRKPFSPQQLAAMVSGVLGPPRAERSIVSVSVAQSEHVDG